MRLDRLPERWPVGAAIGIGTFVLLLGVAAFSPGLMIALAVAFIFSASCLALVNRTEGAGSGLAGEADRVRHAELALAGASSADGLAKELATQVMDLLDAPAVAVMLDRSGEAIHIEAGDTQRYAVTGPGSRMRLLTTGGALSGTVAVAAPLADSYGDRDEQVLDTLASRASSTLRRLALFDHVRTEEEGLSDVIAAASDGIFHVGPDLVVRSWNPSMERFTGVTEADAVGKQCCDAFRPRDANGEPIFGAACPGRSGERVEVLVQLDPRASVAAARAPTTTPDA